jgi:hypothetical protein
MKLEVPAVCTPYFYFPGQQLLTLLAIFSGMYLHIAK